MNFGDLVERRIREAQLEGKFKNIKGEGAPIDLQENPFEDPEMRLAYKMLKNAGFCPEWIELMKQIDEEISQVERVWENYRFNRQRQIKSAQNVKVVKFAETIREIDRSRNIILQRLETRWREINSKITYFNAIVPVDSLKKPLISIDKMRESFSREFPLLSGYLEK